MYLIRQLLSIAQTPEIYPANSFEVASFKHAISTPVTILLSSLDETAQDSLKKKYRQALLTLKELCNYFTTTTAEDCELSSLLQEVSEMLSFKNQKVKVVSLSSDSEGVLHSVNSCRLKEAVVCLTRNALESAAGTESQSVAILYSVTEKHVLIQIKDFGAGMSWWQKTIAFVPFVSFKAHGRGIGCAFARLVIEEELQGKIEVYSRKDTGTSVECLIPIDR